MLTIIYLFIFMYEHDDGGFLCVCNFNYFHVKILKDTEYSLNFNWVGMRNCSDGMMHSMLTLLKPLNHLVHILSWMPFWVCIN